VATWVEILVKDGDVDRAARQLRRELVERELETRAVTEEAPAGSKGDAAVVGAVAVALVGAGGMVPTLIAVIRDWLARQSGPQRISVKIGNDSIELDRPSFAERERLLERFLAEHAGE